MQKMPHFRPHAVHLSAEWTKAKVRVMIYVYFITCNDQFLFHHLFYCVLPCVGKERREHQDIQLMMMPRHRNLNWHPNNLKLSLPIGTWSLCHKVFKAVPIQWQEGNTSTYYNNVYFNLHSLHFSIHAACWLRRWLMRQHMQHHNLMWLSLQPGTCSLCHRVCKEVPIQSQEGCWPWHWLMRRRSNLPQPWRTPW